MKVFLGFDPGKTGGLCAIEKAGIDLEKMPGTEADLLYWISGYADWDAFALVEWIHPAIQGIGKSAQSKLYGNYMQIRAFLTACDIPYDTITPAKWQQGVGIRKYKDEPKGKWKNRLKQKAQQLFPRVHITLDTADALLIAEYCRRLRA